MNKILIIKEGTLGGLVRITPLLMALHGEIFWLTLGDIKFILSVGHKVHIIDIDKFKKNPRRIRFDLVVNLEDSEEIAKLVAYLNPGRIVGAYWDDEKKKVDYTPESAAWFDMGSISKLKPQAADELKFANRKSYQEMLFGMLGLRFEGEEYALPPIKSAGRTAKER